MDHDDPLQDDVDTAHTDSEAEPATSHDVTEGGVLGAVGGAVVGMLAGGPLGAVIGAVVGGVASAGAVDLVDKHDHDHGRTANDGDGSSVLDASPAPLIAPDVTPIPPVEVPLPVETRPVPAAGTNDLTSSIRERAYEIYDQRGRGDGRDVQDWLSAERELLKV